ncbi:hypothetical protein LOZ58_003201 [Ophidiomyces ophidiicola]|nr:hypothetical protein LOZ66_002005 [Ophidiomyces ophidiicola]KAI1961347.1 hypothetical protein LOZ58_003201 [Ophidiomyces ophidiicola]
MTSAQYHDDDVPLLVDAEPSTPITEQSRRPPSVARGKRTGRRNPTVFVLICVLAVFTLDFGAYLNIAPQTRIYEDIVCRNYYDKHEPGRFPSGTVPEEQCKIKPVQGEVAFVQGLMSSFDAIPSIILLIPYGRLADNPKFGRKTVLLMSMLGLLLNFYWTVFVCIASRVLPLRAIWFGSMFNFIGGGLGVTNAMMMTMITDVVDPDNRAGAFFKTTLAVVVAQLIAPSVASGLMTTKGPWFPFLVGTVLITCCMPFLFTLPETIQLQPLHTAENRLSMDTESSPIDEELWPTNTSSFKKLFHRAWNSSKFIFQSRIIVIVLSAFFLSVIGRKQIDILLLYVSTKYSIRLSDAAFVHSVFAASNIALLLVILPVASKYLTKTLSFSTNAKDLYLSKMSVILLTIGCFALGLSPSIATMIIGLIIYTLGCGFIPLCLSLISTLVEPHHAARLYSIVSLISMAGALVGGPVLAALFNWGLSIGSKWTGLPFFGTGILHVFVAIAINSIRLPQSPPFPEEEREQEST